MSAFFARFATWISGVISRLSPVQTIAFGYLGYIVAITLPLGLPVMWKIEHIGWLDHLFMATSAVSTTGLVTINTPDAYNLGGQLILLFGMQIGGLGYMTLGSFAILASRGRVSESRVSIGKAVFSMPAEFEPIAFIKRAVVFTFVIECCGALALYAAFAKADVAAPLWPAIFHSVSAFCTAGFSVFPDSLEQFRDDGLINAIISALSIAGAIGFIVISDLWLKLTRRGQTITLTSKIILSATFGGMGVGTVALLLDPAIAGLPMGEQLMTAFFQSMSALTTVGFDTQPIGGLGHAASLVLLVLMIMGASPSGTGGGLKSTSWSAGLAAVWSAIRGRRETTFFGHRVPNYRIEAAFATFTLYLIVFTIGCYLLLLADRHRFEDVVFEVASALGTVGLSRGITGDLTEAGKLVVIGLMYIGRVGVISLGLAALARKPEAPTADSARKADFVL